MNVENRNFTLVFADRTSFRAKGLRRTPWNRNFTLVFADRTSFCTSRCHCPGPWERNRKEGKRRGQEGKRARRQEREDVEKMWEDVKMRRCEDEKVWEDVRRWEDVSRYKMRSCEKMWRWEDVKMRRCEDEKMWEDVRRCEKMRRWEDVRRCEKMWRCEDEKMWEDVKMRRCEKMWRWEDVMIRCDDRPPPLEEPFAQTLSGKIHIYIRTYLHLCIHVCTCKFKSIFTYTCNAKLVFAGSLEVKLPTICRDGKAEVGRVREEKSRSEKLRDGESQKRQDAGARKGREVVIHCVFPMICGSGGSKSNLAKAAGAEPAG